jgi:hypothetical protein
MTTLFLSQEEFEDTKGAIRKTGNTMTKRKTTKGQTTIYNVTS